MRTQRRLHLADEDHSSAVETPEAPPKQPFTTSNLDEIEDVVCQVVTPHRLHPAGPGMEAHAQFHHHGVDGLGLFHIRYGRELAVEMKGEHIDTLVTFVMPLSGNGKLQLGREEVPLSADQGVIFRPGVQKFLHYSNDCETVALVIDRARITQFCMNLLGREPNGILDFETAFRLDDGAGQNWLRLVQYAESELRNPNSLVRSIPAARQQFERMVMTGLLFGHQHNYSEALLQPKAAAAPYYVKRAEAFIEANFHRPISLADVAAHAAVSARSLQAGFQSFRNMTPMAFLRSVRLQAVHKALQMADPRTATVTSIAMECGFSHMGEFAAAYKQTFGTAPSQTIGRRG